MAILLQNVQQTGYGPLWKPFIYVTITVAVIVAIGILVGVVYLLKQLSHIRQVRDFEVASAILRDHEDPALFAIRGFVNRHMEEINAFIKDLDTKQPRSREQLDAKIQELSNNNINVEDILRLIAILNHASLFILNEFVSPEVGMEFYPVITRMWELLAPVVHYERVRRSEVRPLQAQWYSLHFQNLAEHMLSPDYEDKVRARLRMSPSSCAKK